MIIFKKDVAARGFTLVELLLVIVLIAILMAIVTLSGANMMDSTNAQTEARRLIRSVHSLRSAWLACYADRQIMLGVSPGYTDNATVGKMISTYSDRSLSDETERYGDISIAVNPGGRQGIYIGFANKAGERIWKAGHKRSAAAIKTMRDVIDRQKNDYNLLINATANSDDVYIRIR